MKRSLICLAVPMMLFAGGCGNSESKKEDKIEVAEKNESTYVDQVMAFSNSFGECLTKMNDLVQEDETLFSNQEEFAEVVIEFSDLYKDLQNLVPDKEYKVHHEKLLRSMSYYADAFSLRLDSFESATTEELSLSTAKMQSGLELYLKSMGAINDIRRGDEVGSTEKRMNKKKEDKEEQQDEA
ncbi:hypothetical protein [Bacillus wiedmannii]|uniref:hypothetical protein n=1 Tax=Bacillus wiedmannii TaxID=1890302 RepID=UPI000BF0B981|nr:hypothetical protein [Bacillus wiedmannii]PEM31183.1 hypothetical protein CN617_05270 [Bacillus wiedmannii]